MDGLVDHFGRLIPRRGMGFYPSAPTHAKPDLQDANDAPISTEAIGFLYDYDQDNDEEDRTKEAIRRSAWYPKSHARDGDRRKAEEGQEVKGDPRSSTERRRRIRALAAKIPDYPTLREIALAVPEPRRRAFLQAITPHLSFKPEFPTAE